MNNQYKNLSKIQKDLGTKSEGFWHKKGETMALNLFHQTSRAVPAYKDFLRKNKINPEKIKTIEDFKNLPLVDKNNYLNAYPLEKLSWNGNIASADMISLSSGSSGEPFYWLRGRSQEEETALSHELFLVDSFEIDKYSTLFIVSFSMGMWVAGTLTHRAVQDIASRYNMTVITPGINTQDVLSVVKKLRNKYDQIIIAGYPPFVKDIIDEGDAGGVEWKKPRIKFLFAAESFSEDWRDYIYSKTGSKNPLKDSLNIYGTADALILGHETPLSIMIRRMAGEDRILYKKIFSTENRTPTLVQYNPALKFFENEGDSLIFSAFSGIPLVRYNIGDSGRVVNFSEMRGALANSGINILKESKKAGISLWKLPFLYVLGRKDHTASLYGLNIYPENVRDALSHDKINKFASGKFSMAVRSDNKFNQYLAINIELKNRVSGVPKNTEKVIPGVIASVLRSKNTEYNELYKQLGQRVEPRISLCKYNDPRFFRTGAKQKWHKKEE